MRDAQAAGERPKSQLASWWFAALAAMSGMLYAAWLLGTWINPGLDEVYGYVSELSARSQPASSLFRSTDALAGVFAMAAAVPWLFRRTGWALVGWGGVVVFGLATAVDGALTPMDCATFVETHCSLREAFGGVSVAHQIHAGTSSLSGAGALIGMIGLGLSARDGSRRPLEPIWAAVWSGITALATGGTLVALLLGGWVGLLQRLQLFAISTWLLALALVTAYDAWNHRTREEQ